MSMNISTFLLTGLLVVAVGGQASCSKSSEEVLGVLSSIEKAINEKDLKGVMENVSKDVIFWPFKDAEIAGRDGYQKYHEGWFANPQPHRIEFKVRQIFVKKDLAFLATDFVLTTTAKDKSTSTSDGRVSWVFRKENKKWMLYHDHFSQYLRPKKIKKVK